MGAALLENTVSPDVARLAVASSFYAFATSGALSGVAMLGASVVVLRTGVLARWLGWSGASIAVAAILGSAAIVENDPAGLFAALNGLAWLAYFLWIADETVPVATVFVVLSAVSRRVTKPAIAIPSAAHPLRRRQSTSTSRHR
jgi:hypothetical protein